MIQNEENIEEFYDFDYSVGQTYINTLEDFNRELLEPYKDSNRHIFYRGERISQLSRPLLPTIYRDKNKHISSGEYKVDITSDYLLNYYQSMGAYVDLFNKSFGNVGKYQLYDICAFSQHYLNNSPLIDFTKSIYAGLSFGLKEKTEFTEDAVLYTVEIDDMDQHYTNNKVVAECWLNDYRVSLYDFKNVEMTPEMVELKKKVQGTSPSAKMIDIATNDLMKFQQGVFLLLSDFNLVDHLYLTRNVRDSIRIKKYMLNKDICVDLVKLIQKEAPWYRFSQLLKISDGLNTAISLNKTNL